MLGGSQYHVDHFLDPISITFSSSSSSSTFTTIITAASHELDYQQYLLLLFKLQWSPTNSTITTTTTTTTTSNSNSNSSKLLRSLLMDVGLSMDAPPPPNHLSNAYMNFYLDTTATTTTTAAAAASATGGGGGDSLQDAAAALYGAPAPPPPPPAPLLPPQLILGLHTNSNEAANEEDEMHKLMIQQQMQVLHHQHHRQHHHHQQHHIQLQHTQLQNQLQQQHNFMKRKSGPLPPSLPVPVPVPPPPSLQQHHQPPRRMQPPQQHSTVISSSNNNNNNYSTGGAMLCGRMDTHLLQPPGGGGGGVDDCPAAVLMQLGGGGGNNTGGGGSLHQVKSSGMDMAMAMAMAAATVTPPPPPPPPSSSSSSTSSSSSPWLDPRLWSRLPEALVQRVLASLPLPSFFRSRLVCKRWYSLLFSDSFLELSASVRATTTTARASSTAASDAAQRSSRWFLLFRKGVWTEAMAFDPAAKSWHRLDLSFLPPRFGVVASAGGLLCCISEERGRKAVLICNPLTRAYVRLPPGLTERLEPTVGLAVDPHTKAYRVLAAGDDLISPFAVKNLTTEIYDSRLQQWSMTAPLPRLCNLESGKTTFANGFFYCMNYSPFSVLAYDTHSRAWSKIQAPMRRFLRTPNLVECRGRLVLVAAVEKNKLNVPKSIRIWGLQASRTSWTELERMPHALYEEFTRVSGHRAFHCIGHGNQILITLPGSPDMLLYDFYEKVWRWAARCPFALNPVSSPDMPSNSQPAPFHAFAYDPRLEALVC